MINFFLGPFLAWCPSVFIFMILVLIILVHLSSRYKFLNIFKKVNFKKLVYLVLGVSLIFDLSLVGIQYYVWRANSFTAYFLPPYQPWSYFISYCFFHFFLANIILAFVSLVVFLIFKIIQKYKSDFINNEELSLLVLACLMISWPRIIIFLVIFLGSSLIAALVNKLVLKKQLINLTYLMLFSLIISLLVGNYLLQALSLTVLAV